MLKTFLFILFVACFQFSQVVIAKTYVGKGAWKNSGGLGGHYEVTVEMEGKFFHSTYSDLYGKKMRNIVVEGPQSSLTLLINGQFIGTGYCQPLFCQFNWQEGEDMMEESWLYDERELYRYGRRSYGDGEYVLWEELSLPVKLN